MRIVVTGIGVVTCAGGNKEEFWKSLWNGESGLTTVYPEPVTEENLYRMGGFIREAGIGPDAADGTRTTQLAQIAFEEAIRDAALPICDENRDRIGLSVGTSIGGYQQMEQYLRHGGALGENVEDGWNRLRPSFTAACLAEKYGLEGPLVTNGAACAASSNAFGSALALLRGGLCDAVITGGCDPVSFLSQCGFLALKALSRELCRPFNADRKGILIGEAGAFLVLEREKTARERKAGVYCELAGCGCSNDAYHATAPDPKAGGAVRSMRAALKDAGIGPEKIDYINMHGTGTELNDRMELTALDAVFGDKAGKVCFSSIKGAVGHTLGCAGAVEAAAAVLALANGLIPPTALLETPIVEGRAMVWGAALPKKMEYVMSNSFAFGGNSSSLIFRACTD